MSAINNALSELAQQRPTMASLEQAKVAKVKRSRAWLWLVAGFAASLAVGGWAVSQQQVTVSEQVSTLTTPIAFSEQEVPSPTKKIVTNDGFIQCLRYSLALILNHMLKCSVCLLLLNQKKMHRLRLRKLRQYQRLRRLSIHLV